MKRKTKISLPVAILIAIIGAIFGLQQTPDAGPSNHNKNTAPRHTTARSNAEHPTSRRSVVLESVVDGDTIRVRDRGTIYPVRLIGVDTPERRENDKAFRDADRSGNDLKVMLAAGEQAADFVRSQLRPNTELELETDIEPRDRYHRVLGYIYLPNGEMLNELILRAGYARPYTFPPNVRYAERFRVASRIARDESRGLWGSGVLKER